MMTRRTLLLGAAAAALAGRLAGDEKKADPAAASGSWTRKGGEMKVEFPEKGVLRISPHGDKEAFTVVCSCTVARDGTVKARITDVEGKEEIKARAKDLVPVGSEFSFRWKVKDGTATLDEVKGDKADALKAHLEGEYEKK